MEFVGTTEFAHACTIMKLTLKNQANMDTRIYEFKTDGVRNFRLPYR